MTRGTVECGVRCKSSATTQGASGNQLAVASRLFTIALAQVQ